jgi:hypothetical protein
MLIVLKLIVAASALGEDWPGWRGPRGEGTSLESRAPTRWDGRTGSNLLWKTKLAGGGHASPIIWGDRIFLVSCDGENEARNLASYDRRNGKLLWQRTVIH